MHLFGENIDNSVSQNQITLWAFLWVILCRLPEKGRKETEETIEETEEGNREERGTGMKVKKQKK